MHSTSSPLCEFPSLMSQICLCIQMDLFKLHRKKSRKNVNWNQKWAKKQLNILRNVMWLYSCGPPKVPTYRTREGKKMSEQSTMGRGFLHRIFSQAFYWWTWQSGRTKSPPNKQFIPHHLSREKNRTAYKKLAKFPFFLVKAKIIFFRFGLLVSLGAIFLCFCCVCWWKFRRMNECSGGEKEAQTVKYAERIK